MFAAVLRRFCGAAGVEGGSGRLGVGVGRAAEGVGCDDFVDDLVTGIVGRGVVCEGMRGFGKCGRVKKADRIKVWKGRVI